MFLLFTFKLEPVEITSDSTGKTPLDWARSRLSRLKQSMMEQDSDNLVDAAIKKELEDVIATIIKFIEGSKLQTQNLGQIQQIQSKLADINHATDIDELQSLLEGLKV